MCKLKGTVIKEFGDYTGGPGNCSKKAATRVWRQIRNILKNKTASKFINLYEFVQELNASASSIFEKFSNIYKDGRVCYTDTNVNTVVDLHPTIKDEPHTIEEGEEAEQPSSTTPTNIKEEPIKSANVLNTMKKIIKPIFCIDKILGYDNIQKLNVTLSGFDVTPIFKLCVRRKRSKICMSLPKSMAKNRDRLTNSSGMRPSGRNRCVKFRDNFYSDMAKRQLYKCKELPSKQFEYICYMSKEPSNSNFEYTQKAQNKFIDENRESIGKGTDEDCGPPHVWISNVFSMKNYK